MSRPGFVLEVDDRTPPLLVQDGEGFRLERFPHGTRVVYPPESLPALRDVDAAIGNALRAPAGREPLETLLRPGMRLTIAFDDLSRPLPSMRAPDVRQRVIERVVTAAAEAGVDDVQLVAATGLHRRMTASELRHIVGERVFRSFYPTGGLRNHDAEDPDNLRLVGRTERGEEVEIHRGAAESDLLVHVTVAAAADAGRHGLPVGLGSFRTVRHAHGPAAGEAAPVGSADADGPGARMSRLLAGHLNVFTIEVTLDNEVFGPPYDFLGKREWEWGLRDQGRMLAAKRALAVAPSRLRHRLYQDLRAPYGVTGVAAGDAEAVRVRTRDTADRQQLVEVDGPSDVLVLGVPFQSPYSVGSVMNPLLAAGVGLGQSFGSYRGQPVVRRGGAVILYHPVPWDFSQLHHPSYVDFFEEVLTVSTDPAVVEEKFEQQYATDPWYLHLYRTSHAYHGVHPFLLWYRVARATAHVGDVIWVGADRRSVARLGFRTASTLTDALEMASSTVGRSPSITYLHSPPHILADVRG